MNEPSTRLYPRCFFCHALFVENELLERLPAGKRFAFDPGRGRLWIICHSCHRWNLLPVEDRWEALEELEKVSQDQSHLLSRTDNVALLRSGVVEMVRVGAATLTEEAWWRYSRELIIRRARFQRLRLTMGAMTGAVALGGLTLGVGALGVMGLRPVLNIIARETKFGPVAWRGAARCVECGSVLRELQFRGSDRLTLTREGTEQQLSLRVRCVRCQQDNPEAGFRIIGTSAEHLLRRVLAYRHYQGASEEQVRKSATIIDQLGSPQHLTDRLALQRMQLGQLDPSYAFALEIAINDETERRMLTLEVAELEARWREEEKLAAIVDEELTFLPRMIRKRPLGPSVEIRTTTEAGEG